MNLIKKIIWPVCLFSLLALYSVHISSCANTKGAPTGGPKDTIPPKVVAIMPDSNALNVPRIKAEIKITFDEYIQLKEANKNILLSPPQKKRLLTKLKGKSLIVTFPANLDSAKSYTIYFGEAIADNNESNPMSGYTYSFSTGNVLDSMILSGTVIDNITLLPLDNISVAAYSNPTDSCLITTLPTAITRTDKFGYFCFRNLKPIPYQLFAFKDENNNNLYDQSNEKVGFVDTLITPRLAFKKDLLQITRFDIKDTSGLRSRPTEADIYLFKEKPSKQYISNKERLTYRSAFIKFNAPDVQIKSFTINEIPQDKIIKQFNATNDSLLLWINTQSKPKDTLVVNINYMKTDSTGLLSPFSEEVKLIIPYEKSDKNRNKNRDKEKERDINKKNGDTDKNKEKEQVTKNKREDLLSFELISKPDKVEQDGYIFEFTEPLVKASFDSLSLTYFTPKKLSGNLQYTVKQDSTEIRRYILTPNEPFRIGYQYELKVPQAAFKDINGFTNDSLVNNIALPIDDKLSTLTINVINVKSRYIIELVNDTRSSVYRKYIINSNCSLPFKYLAPGKYSIRITQDLNSNLIHDTGSLIPRKQPEKVRLYKLPNGNKIIEIKERTDIDQTIDISQLF
jgi:hypothetical protein